MGGLLSCGRPETAVPSPMPATLEDWARLGATQTLKVHAWLSNELEKELQAAKAAKAKARRSSRKAKGGADEEGGDASAQETDFVPRIRVRFEVRGSEGDVLDVYETPATLQAVRDGLHGGAPQGEEGGANSPAQPAAGASPRSSVSSGNLLHNGTFLRLAGWLVLNRRVLLDVPCPVPLTVRVAHHSCHTLMPEMSPSKVRRLLTIAKKLMRKAPERHCTWVGEDGLDRWLSTEEKFSLGDSVFFGFFFRVVVSGGGGWGMTGGQNRYTAPEFVQAVDRFCTFTEEELLRFSFFCLAKVGMRPGETPFVAVSSLSRIFSELREAARERGHTSRPFLDEIRKRAKALSTSMDPRVRVMKTAAIVLMREREDDEGEGTGRAAQEDEEVERQWQEYFTPDGDAREGPKPGQPRVPSRRAGAGVEAERELGDDDEEENGGNDDSAERSLPSLATGPEDLLSVAEYLDMAMRSPISVFDLIYLQLQMRRKTFGVGYWTTRQQDIEAYGARAHEWRALTAGLAAAEGKKAREGEEEARDEGEDGNDDVDADKAERPSSAGKAGEAAGRQDPKTTPPPLPPLFFGYERFRADPSPDPFLLAKLPHTARVSPVAVPPAVRFALARGTITFPPTFAEDTLGMGGPVVPTAPPPAASPSAPPPSAEEDEQEVVEEREDRGDRGGREDEGREFSDEEDGDAAVPWARRAPKMSNNRASVVQVRARTASRDSIGSEGGRGSRRGSAVAPPVAPTLSPLTLSPGSRPSSSGAADGAARGGVEGRRSTPPVSARRLSSAAAAVDGRRHSSSAKGMAGLTTAAGAGSAASSRRTSLASTASARSLGGGEGGNEGGGGGGGGGKKVYGGRRGKGGRKSSKNPYGLSDAALAVDDEAAAAHWRAAHAPSKVIE